jgi:predicted PurR-regulated permease PerM
MEFTEQRESDQSSTIPRGLIVLLGLTGIVVAVAGMRSVAGIIAPVFLGLMLSITAEPLGRWLRSKGWPAWASVVAMVGVVYLVLIGLALSIVVSLAKLAGLLPMYEERFDELTDNVRAGLADVGIGDAQIDAALHSVDLGLVFGLLEDFLLGLLGVFSNLIFLLTVVLFMGMDAARFPERLRVAAGERPQAVGALSVFAAGTRRYLLVSTVFGLIVAVIDTVALAWLGIPLPVLWGLLAFITNYIPNIGFVIGVIPPALLGLLEGGPGLLAAVIVVYSVINMVIQSGIQPKFVGDAVGLSVTVSFLSMVVWTWVLGPLGALLALPLSLLTKAMLLDIDPSTRWISALIAGGGSKREPPQVAAAPAAESEEHES